MQGNIQSSSELVDVKPKADSKFKQIDNLNDTDNEFKMNEQYDANKDFAVFATKDQTVGGHMDLQEKQNIAENIIDQKVVTPSVSVLNSFSVDDSLTKIKQHKVEAKSQIKSNPNNMLGIQNINMMPEDSEIVELNEI